MVILSDPNCTSLKRKRSCDDQYDVFLSFRGSDTRNGFADHLYHHLKQAGILTFRDHEGLERGESLKQQLENAIKQSSISIIVFSQNYASSSWCLDEVVRILEQKKMRSQRHYKVLPVFYQVDASDVRCQSGRYGQTFEDLKKKGCVSLEKINLWKAALTEAANFVGLGFNNETEMEFIGKIVNEVIKNLPNRKILDVPEHIIGMNYRANQIDSWFKDKSMDNNVLVFWGFGGMGKTTIAKHCFNKYFRDFDSSCFLARITAMWDQNGVCSLQSQLLSNILNKQRDETTICNCDEGTEKIKRAIRNKKVFIVLDDVNETEQLKALLGHPQRLYSGSKIIITTRNMSLVRDFDVSTKVHKIEGLNSMESLELFSWHAFQQRHPPEEYIKLSTELLLRCEGHPLSLVVLGSSLRKRLDTVFWEKQLQKWNEIGNPNIQKVMQTSYESLEDDMVKNLFLHVACFFVGEEEDYVVKLLDHCGLHATVGIQNLIDRCLLTTYDNKLMMHQVIQDMGREIVRQESPYDPGRRRLLWYHEDSFTVLKYDKGTEFVQGLILDGQKINRVDPEEASYSVADANSRLVTRWLGYVKRKKEEVFDRYLPLKAGEVRIDAFAKMVNLKLMKLNHVHVIGRCTEFPKELRWISWHGFPLDYVPTELPLDNLVALDLQHSLLKQVWKGYMAVKSLKFIDLSYSLELYQTPDFRGLPQLERLVLKGCSNLVKVCKTIGILKGLLLLDLSYCKSLRDLPGLPQSLITLNLSGCSHLGKFPREQQNLKTSDGYRMVKFASPSIFTGPVILLAYLPHLLVELNLGFCNLSDECFPRYFNGLSLLERLDLSGNLITRLPDCVRNLSSSRLSTLKISYCPQLRSVIYPPSTVTNLCLNNNKQLGKTKTRLKSMYFHLITDESTGHIENEGCFKWVKASNVDRKVIQNLGLESVAISGKAKVLYEFGIFSTFVQSTRVPHCFKTYYASYTDGEGGSGVPCHISVPFGEMGTAKLRYTIPSSVGRKIQGLNICFIRRLDPIHYRTIWIYGIDVTVYNMTKDLAWTYKYEEKFEGQQRPCEEHMWVSTWKCVDLLEAGDELEVSFKTLVPDWLENLRVKECGIRTVYEEDLSDNTDVYSEDDESSLSWNEQMDVSFTNYRTPGTHYFFIGRSPRLSDIKEKMDGRAVQFVDWWGPNLNWRSKEGQLKYFLYYHWDNHCLKL